MSSYDPKIEIELLKKDVSIISRLCEKFDLTIDKMQDIATNLSKLVSLHEQRLESQEESTKEVEILIEARRIEHNKDIKDVNDRICEVNNDLIKKMDALEQSILDEIKILKSELKTDKGSFGKRLTDIETWKYTLVGVILVVVWLAAKVDFIKLLLTR